MWAGLWRNGHMAFCISQSLFQRWVTEPKGMWKTHDEEEATNRLLCGWALLVCWQVRWQSWAVAHSGYYLGWLIRKLLHRGPLVCNITQFTVRDIWRALSYSEGPGSWWCLWVLHDWMKQRNRSCWNCHQFIWVGFVLSRSTFKISSNCTSAWGSEELSEK